jgi:hypothetical protein
MFANSSITNLKAILEEQGVTLDTSEATGISLWYIVRDSTITHLPIIDATNANMVNIFSWDAALEYVEKFIIPIEEMQTSGEFEVNYKTLKHMPVEGTFYRNILVKNAPLDLESAVSFIMELANYTGTENEFVYSIYFSTTTLDLLEAEGNAAPDGGTWVEYVGNLGWNM